MRTVRDVFHAPARRSAARLARRVPDPARVHLPDQQLARRNAARRVRQPARLRRHLGDTRRARLGRGLVGHERRARQPDRADHRRAAKHRLDAPEHLDRAGNSALGVRLRRPAQQSRDRSRYLPVGVLRAAWDAAAAHRTAQGRERRRRDHRAGRADHRRDRRADAAGADQPCAVSQRVHPGCAADHREGARRRRDRDPGRLSRLRNRAVRRDRVERRLLPRRRAEVDVRRAGRRVPLRPRGSPAHRAAKADRLDGAQAALRLRGGRDGLPRRRVSLPERHRRHPQPVRQPARRRDHRAGGRRGDPRQVAAPDRC